MHRTRIDVDEGGSPCYEIVRAVTAVTGDDPTTAEPLYDVVDPDAIEDLLRSFRRTEANLENAFVEFTTSECRVAVYADGLLEIRPADR